jgi:hypothetical protein
MDPNPTKSWRIQSMHPPKTPKGNISSSTIEMLQTDITVTTQGARISYTHAKEATNYHKSSQAINQLSRHRRQPPLILHSEGKVVTDRLNRRRVKQSKNAEVRIKLAMPSTQCKAAME